MLRRRGDLRDNYFLEVSAALFDPLDLDPGEREKFGELVNARRQLDEFAQPVNGKFHDVNAVIPRLAKRAEGPHNCSVRYRENSRVI
jgi:hypothetical protein